MSTYQIIEDKLRWQVKAGSDYETYKVGDKVPFKLHESAGSGDWLDGVYEAYQDGDGTLRAWVIVKDHHIEDLEVTSAPEGSDEWRGQRGSLEAQHGVAFDRTLWPESAWAARAERERIAEEEYQSWCREKGYDPKALGTAGAYAITCTLKQEGFARQILPPISKQTDATAHGRQNEVWAVCDEGGQAHAVLEGMLDTQHTAACDFSPRLYSPWRKDGDRGRCPRCSKRELEGFKQALATAIEQGSITGDEAQAALEKLEREQVAHAELPRYKFGEPKFIGQLPERVDIEVIKINDPSKPIGFVTYQELGAEVYRLPEPWPEGLDIRTTPILKNLDDLKVGDKIVAPTLFGFMRATVDSISGNRGSALSESGKTFISLDYAKRQEWDPETSYSAWVSSMSGNLAAISKLEFYDKPLGVPFEEKK